MLQKDLIDKIKTAKFFTILDDKVESHHVKQLPLCIRSVDYKKDMREEFLEFGKCNRVTGGATANQIIHIIEKAGHDVKDCREYNGASNMSSEAVGVQAHIKSLCEKAVYAHCCRHSLSLVVVFTCNLPVIRNVFDKVQQVTQMFIKG